MAGTDGVGTKLKLAFETGIHDTIGIDLVNSITVSLFCNAKKLLFYILLNHSSLGCDECQ